MMFTLSLPVGILLLKIPFIYTPPHLYPLVFHVPESIFQWGLFFFARAHPFLFPGLFLLQKTIQFPFCPPLIVRLFLFGFQLLSGRTKLGILLTLFLGDIDFVFILLTSILNRFQALCSLLPLLWMPLLASLGVKKRLVT